MSLMEIAPIAFALRATNDAADKSSPPFSPLSPVDSSNNSGFWDKNKKMTNCTPQHQSLTTIKMGRCPIFIISFGKLESFIGGYGHLRTGSDTF